MNIGKASVVELQRRVKEIESELAELNVQRSKLNHEKSLIAEELERRKTARAEATVSEHALLRWLERVHGVDLEEVKREILTDRVVQWIELGTSRIKMPDIGVDLVVKDNVIVSCVQR